MKKLEPEKNCSSRRFNNSRPEFAIWNKNCMVVSLRRIAPVRKTPLPHRLVMTHPKETEANSQAVLAMDVEITATFPSKRRSMNSMKPSVLNVAVASMKIHAWGPRTPKRLR